MAASCEKLPALHRFGVSWRITGTPLCLMPVADEWKLWL
jgi:hypothetical protein